MTPRRWIGLGAVWMALAVVLGAFGAHALNDRLIESGDLENWRTGVRYQAWHAIALIFYGLFQKSWPIGPLAGWSFLLGSILFSGSIYALCFDFATGLMGPITPIGGVLLIVGWITLALRAFRR